MNGQLEACVNSRNAQYAVKPSDSNSHWVYLYEARLSGENMFVSGLIDVRSTLSKSLSGPDKFYFGRTIWLG